MSRPTSRTRRASLQSSPVVPASPVPPVAIVPVPVPTIVAGTTHVPVPVKRVNNEMSPEQTGERIGDLLTMLRASTGDRSKGKKIRRMLRALGHRGGLRSTSPL